jgi:hypothetical protein
MTATKRHRDDVARAAANATSALDLFARTSMAMRRVVDFDAAAWMGTDPATGLPTSPVRIDDLEGVTQQMCATHWQHELLDDDVNLFRDLARRAVPAAALRGSVAEPARSGRFRRFLDPLGLADELRAVLRVGDAPWGTITLWRRTDAPPFSAREVRLVAGLSAPLGEALRRQARPTDGPVASARHDRPGLIVFGADGDITSINDEARSWLDEFPEEPVVASDRDVRLPVWLLITMFRASAIRHGAGDGTARTRVKSRRGRWLACHASCLRRPDGSFGDTAIVIEPAQPASIAPIVIDAYDLTEREQQIIRLIARARTRARSRASCSFHRTPSEIT